MSRKRWFDKAQSEAQKFLKLNTNAGSTNIPIYNAQRAGCTSSRDCASGWSCKRGLCQPPETSEGGLDGCDGTGGEDSDNLACPASNSNSGCTQTGAGECDTAYEACCTETRCCRFSNSGIRCGCGDCDEQGPCDKFCDDYKSALSYVSAECEGKFCDECSACEKTGFSGITDLYECVKKPKGAVPCHCERPPEEGEGATGCEDCETCEEDGTCTPDAKECDVCAVKEGPCECNPEQSFRAEVCIKASQSREGIGFFSLQSIANKEHLKLCEAGCEDECVGASSQCETSVRCGHGLTATCNTGERLVGEATTSGGVTLPDGSLADDTCVLCENCSEPTTPDSDCCPLECNCHSDCGDCRECAAGSCQVTAKCEEAGVT